MVYDLQMMAFILLHEARYFFFGISGQGAKNCVHQPVRRTVKKTKSDAHCFKLTGRFTQDLQTREMAVPVSASHIALGDSGTVNERSLFRASPGSSYLPRPLRSVHHDFEQFFKFTVKALRYPNMP